MQCQTCNEVKLSGEFFAEPLTPQCDHINLSCINCILKKLAVKSACPACSAAVSKEVLASITILQKAFQVVLNSEAKPLVVQGNTSGPIVVFVMGLDGAQFSLNLQGSSTVKQLRSAIGQQIKHAADKLILHCNNQTLKVCNLCV